MDARLTRQDKANELNSTLRSPQQHETGLDAGRLIASCSIVVLHCLRWDSFTSEVLNQVCRFAVPYFFMTSGFFFHSKIYSDQILRKTLTSVLPLTSMFIFWSLVYAADAPTKEILQTNPAVTIKSSLSQQWNNDGLRIFLAGTAKHLWFIPSLILAMILSACIYHYFGLRAVYATASLAFLIGLLLGPYGWLLGYSPSFYSRNGIFFSYPFFVCGFWIRHNNPSPPTPLLYTSLFAFCTAQLLEAALIYSQNSQPFSSPDYLLSTFPFAIACFFLLRRLRIPKKYSTLCANAAIGIYFLHPIVYKHIQFLKSSSQQSFPDAICLTLVALVSSATCSILYFRGKHGLKHAFAGLQESKPAQGS